MSFQSLDAVFAIGLAILYVLSVYPRKPRLKPLPGPPGYPIVGNAFDLPQYTPWKTYKEWSQKYDSDIVFLRLLGTPVVVLNSADVATQLLEKRSRIYSDRPHSVMLHELAGWTSNFGFMPYGDHWRASRRAFHQHFNEKEVGKYSARSLKYVRKLLVRLLDDPAGFLGHMRWMSGSTIMDITYGFDVQDEGNPFLILAERAADAAVQSGNAGSYLVDVFPILKYVPPWAPGAHFQRQAAEWKKSILDGIEKPLKAVTEALMTGRENTSVASSLLSNLADLNDEVDYKFVEGVTGTAFTAGQDTTVSTLQSFALAMAMHPDVQRSAQEELDCVVVTDRLPELADRDSLPMVSAILWEVLRWHPVSPLAIPHKLMEDDEYQGLHIPAGSVVVCNVWAILHDELVFSDPEKFDPSRFLTSDHKLDRYREGAFGLGRRICPGRHLALQTLWLAMAHILATFRIEKPVDKDGDVMEPLEKFSNGVISYPTPFEAKFVPRSAASAQLIRSAESSGAI